MKEHEDEGVKKKTMVLKANHQFEDSLSEDEEEDIALLSRKFRKFLKNKNS